MILDIFGSLAEFERSLIRERTTAGLEAAKRMGRRGGSPPALFNVDLQAAKTLLLNQKITAREVAERLNVDQSTLYRHFIGGRSYILEESTKLK